MTYLLSLSTKPPSQPLYLLTLPTHSSTKNPAKTFPGDCTRKSPKIAAFTAKIAGSPTSLPAEKLEGLRPKLRARPLLPPN